MAVSTLIMLAGVALDRDSGVKLSMRRLWTPKFVPFSGASPSKTREYDDAIRERRECYKAYYRDQSLKDRLAFRIKDSEAAEACCI